MTTVPTWEQFMLPTLQVLADGMARSRRELFPLVGAQAGLTPEQFDVLLRPGAPLYADRIGWALSFLANIAALRRPNRGVYEITEGGKWLLANLTPAMREADVKVLTEDPTSPIQPYVSTGSRQSRRVAEPSESALTPKEQVESGISRINSEIETELLARLQGNDPAFFEQAVVKLLLAMGYGWTATSGAATKRSNDGGIDGVIDQDVLGLSRVYMQAKRYAEGNTVGRPDIQSFVGALSGRADSGIFITTSRFSDGATEYANSVPTRIILIDGKRLTELMIRFRVGVQVKETYNLVDIDEDFFA